ncbi:receptor-like protein 43 [Eucalyptus grandis]|uniref:receptor-like protein 43 n=1 Tax=Eucalyptus grandis TaxID=71139 RepID=UPI00192EFFF7|nr:receptor-like protein 43 [Eucalyptus grandis]
MVEGRDEEGNVGVPIVVPVEDKVVDGMASRGGGGSSNSIEVSTLGSLNHSSPHKAESPSESNSNTLLQNLTKLRVLILDGLNMSGIDVSGLRNLSPSLQVLSLSSCNEELAGYLPESTWNSSLKVLDLSSTGFSGVLPESIGDLHSLEILWLYHCNFNGSIPSSIGNLTRLARLELSFNELSGQLRTSSMENLIIIDLNSNLIQGPFLPPSLPNLVLIFSLASNRVSGYIPGSICEMKGLQILDLSGNNFTGTIPQCLGNISDSLLLLDLQENGLFGTISLTFGKNAVLRSLHLNGNKFEGLLPRSVINCTQLEALVLSGNKLNDTFPRWLETLPSLRVLVLRSNRLHGSIGNPRTEFPFPQLRILDLSSNELTGPLPSTYFVNLKAMISTDQDGSKLRYMDQGYYQDSINVIDERT